MPAEDSPVIQRLSAALDRFDAAIVKPSFRSAHIGVPIPFFHRRAVIAGSSDLHSVVCGPQDFPAYSCHMSGNRWVHAVCIDVVFRRVGDIAKV